MVLEPSLRKVATALYESLNTPRSLTAAILLRYKEWDQLVDLKVDPRNFLEGSCGAEAYRKDAQASDFLRKSPAIPLSRDLVKAAEETFQECENKCLITNQTLDLILNYPAASNDPELFGRMRQVLHHARKIAGRILGPVPETLDGGFGPGTSFELKDSTYTTLADKLWTIPHTTKACAPVFEHLFWPTFWGRTRLELGLPLPAQCRGNRFTTVPKDSTKRRGICIEPLGNLFCQLGIGRYLKRRLSRVGLEVAPKKVITDPIQLLTTRQSKDGQTIHREIACEGSIHGNWATLDLSNASDTVAFELVRAVLPPDWFELLCACRSPLTLYKGRWVHLEKFSSMGNGFTFELETLIFACLIAAETGLKPGHDFFVYGDDILVPASVGRDVWALLEAFGFEVNRKKSFLTGPFRESCGGDFFSGYNVRPVLVTDHLESPIQWAALHNELVRRWGNIPAAHRCVDPVPWIFRVRVPRKLGHVGFWLAGRPIRRRRDCISETRVLKSSPRRLALDRWHEGFTYVLAVMGVSSSGITPRGEASTELGWYSVS